MTAPASTFPYEIEKSTRPGISHRGRKLVGLQTIEAENATSLVGAGEDLRTASAAMKGSRQRGSALRQCYLADQENFVIALVYIGDYGERTGTKVNTSNPDAKTLGAHR